ncbi:hypothetical protein [Streptomyces eurocidicus]|uniref:Uncharacterized protein n=1 Tax=Streptomyces eurocidicus TaxID=66423 RepID=A0A7W8BGI3_STREU|nr:hypothetical protein [Streptomyces eurocidicus]MBB5122932.1 hypothetical protein [Streptomyces eurocidicus]MBF6055026.1 hypothetical protein [Streptomyces eurocidicus]
MVSAHSLTFSALRPLIPSNMEMRRLSPPWRLLDDVALETMRAESPQAAREIVAQRWDARQAQWLPNAFSLSGRQESAVGLRLAAISLNCGWHEVIPRQPSLSVPVPERFRSLWKVVAHRLGTEDLGAAPLLGIANYGSDDTSRGAIVPALRWSATDEPSRIDLLLAAAARIDAITAPVLGESRLLNEPATRPWAVLRVMDRMVQAQRMVQELLARQIEAVTHAPFTTVGQEAAMVLGSGAPDAPYSIPSRMVTPVQQALDALLGMPLVGRGAWHGRGARRHLTEDQIVALRALDRVGDAVRALVLRREQVARAHRAAVAEVCRSQTLYRRLINAVTGPVAALPMRDADWDQRYAQGQ